MHIGVQLAVSATVRQKLISGMCPPCVVPKCWSLEPVPTHNEVFTGLCRNVSKFVQRGDFLIVFLKSDCPWELLWSSLRHCPLLPPSDTWGTAGGAYDWLPETPLPETMGPYFSGVLFLPPLGSLCGTGIRRLWRHVERQKVWTESSHMTRRLEVDRLILCHSLGFPLFVLKYLLRR